MSNPGPTPHHGNLSKDANELHRSVSTTLDDSSPIKTPEEEAALDGKSLLHQKQGREMDLIDGLQTTSDLVYKLLDMICELQLRVRQLEEKCQTPPPRRSKRFNCAMICKDNVLKL